MASSIPLHLFPSSTPHPPPPRKSSLQRPQPLRVTQTQGQLKGLALQVTADPASPPRILQAPDTYKHSLFCEPSSSSGTGRGSPGLPRRQHARRRLSRPESLTARSPGLHRDIVAPKEEDQLSPLPVNAQFGSSPRLGRHPSKHLKQPTVPGAILVNVAEPAVIADDDQLSPLPEKTQFLPAWPRSSEFPAAPSQHSAGSPPTRSTTAASRKTKTPAPPPIKSIFPEYDRSRPLDQQPYYPTEQAYAQALPCEKISKVNSPIQKPTLKRSDSAFALVDGYEHIPFANDSDLASVWNASNDQFPVAGRKIRLGLHQPASQDTTITIGTAGLPLFSMARASPQSSDQKAGNAKHWALEKYNRSQRGIPVAVAQLTVPQQSASNAKFEPEPTVIFPQAAAIRAIQAVANSPAAAAIATFDPTAASPEAARLGKDAVAEAHRRYACHLSRTTRKRDSLGAVTATYDLNHPLLGTLAITVTKKIKSTVSRESRAKISIHHPSATPAAIVADTLVLAFLDFARDACVLDLPGILALDCAYTIDTAITALLAVAAIENSMLQSEAITFDPPPTAPFATSTTSKKDVLNAKKSERWSKRSSRVIDRMQGELIGSPPDVGAPVQGAIKFIGFSLKTAVNVLEAGARVVVHLARKV